MKNYTRLTQEERWQIQAYKESGKSIGWISRKLKRNCVYVNPVLGKFWVSSCGTFVKDLEYLFTTAG